MEKTPEELAEQFNAKMNSLETLVKNAVSKEDLTAIKEMVKEIKEDNSKTEAIEKLTKSLEAQGEVIAKMETQGVPGNKKGEYIKFVEKNLTENKDISSDRNYSATLTVKAAALMSTANVTPNVEDGYSPLFGNYVDMEIGHAPKADPFILPLITVKNQPGTESIWYTDRVNEEGDAEFIAEGALKPLIDAEWATSKAPIKEVAERWKFTKRLMNHTSSIVSDFREHANELIENKIDDGLVSGDGLTTNLAGIETLGTAFIVPTSLANYYVEANIYDAINAIATAVRLNNFKGSMTAVLNTVWKAQMQGIKKTDGEYIIPPFVTQDGNNVGETRVVFTNRLDEAKIICGDLKKFNAVFSENVEYDEGYENDDFSKNLVSRKLEAFLGTYMKASDAGSIIVDDIATVLTAIAVI